MEGSCERLFHDTGVAEFLLLFGESGDAARELRCSLLERAIGVIYRPNTERWSHYFEARIADQFDAVIHLEETRALEALGPPIPEPERELVPETYPTGV
jgi:erythromycin esterase-like protein